MLKKLFLKLLLLIFLILLVYPLTYLSAWIYKSFAYWPVGGGFLSLDPYIFAGFLMSSLFILALFLTLNLRLIISILILIILNIIALTFFWGIWMEDLIILSASLWLGLVLGGLIKLTANKFKKTSN